MGAEDTLKVWDNHVKKLNDHYLKVAIKNGITKEDIKDTYFKEFNITDMVKTISGC